MRVTIEFNRPIMRRPRRWAAVVLAAAALLVPGLALASHQFSDVPISHPFHTDIAKLYGARITTGCSATTYCPDANMTRGQMAAFLNRGLPRAAIAQLSATATSANEVPAGTLTVRASGPTGGTALVLLNATVWTYTSTAGCPCQLGFTLVHGPSTVSTYVDLQNPSGGDSYSDVHGSDQLLVAIPTGVNQTFSVTVSRTIGTAPLTVSGELTALVVPYDGLGNNPVVGAALESATERTNGE